MSEDNNKQAFAAQKIDVDALVGRYEKIVGQKIDVDALVDYYEKVFQIRNTILKIYKEHGLGFEEEAFSGRWRDISPDEEKKEMIPHFFHPIAFNGAVALKHYHTYNDYYNCFGLEGIVTPLGMLAVNDITSYYGDGQKRDALGKIRERFGEESVGDLSALTKDADGNELPLPIELKISPKAIAELSDLWDQIRPAITCQPVKPEKFVRKRDSNGVVKKYTLD